MKNKFKLFSGICVGLCLSLLAPSVGQASENTVSEINNSVISSELMVEGSDPQKTGEETLDQVTPAEQGGEDHTRVKRTFTGFLKCFYTSLAYCWITSILESGESSAPSIGVGAVDYNRPYATPGTVESQGQNIPHCAQRSTERAITDHMRDLAITVPGGYRGPGNQPGRSVYEAYVDDDSPTATAGDRALIRVVRDDATHDIITVIRLGTWSTCSRPPGN